MLLEIHTDITTCKIEDPHNRSIALQWPVVDFWMGVVIKHNLLDPNPRALLVQNISLVQKVGPHEGFLTHK